MSSRSARWSRSCPGTGLPRQYRRQPLQRPRRAARLPHLQHPSQRRHRPRRPPPLKRPSSSIRSARCAHPNATLVRPGSPAEPSRRRWRAGSRPKPVSILARSRRRARAAASSRAKAPPATPGHATVAKPAGDPERVTALYEAGTYEEVPLDNMRRTIAARLIEAKQTIPHFYLSADVTIERLIEVREESNAAAPKAADGQPACKLPINDCVR